MIGIVMLCGYLLGSLNPAVLISGLKGRDLREVGTKNPGASNTLLVFGKGCAAIVMLLDIAKAVAAVKLGELILPDVPRIGMLAGAAAVVGHIYPFYLRFRGGKGLAAYGGLVLAVDPQSFLLLLTVALCLMLVTDRSVAMPLSAAVLFPILIGLRTGDPVRVLLAVSVGLLIVLKHRSNLEMALRGEDIRIRAYIKEHFIKRG